MTKFRMDLHALGVELKAAAMTEAMRRAENQEEVLDAVEKALWLRPRIITGEEEAALSFAGATSAFPGETVAVADVGGGSTVLRRQSVFP